MLLELKTVTKKKKTSLLLRDQYAKSMIILKCLGSLLFVLGILQTSVAQTRDIFHGIELMESLNTAKTKLEPYAQQIKLIEVEKPSFPLSRNREDHIVCLNFQSENGSIAEVVFTFADDQLVFVQAYGNAIAAITGKRKDSADAYIDYRAYWKDYIITKPSKDKVWILSQEAAHPNLFAWENPYLPSNGGELKIYESSGRIPEFLKMGGELANLRPQLEKASDFTHTIQLDGSDPYAQLQVDCFGIEYAGFPRKFEARFGNEKLNAVWILTAQGEEDRIRQKLIAEYGPAIYKDEAWEVFQDWQVMLRKDKPEVLLVTKELGDFYKKDYFKQK